jgi:DNA-binding transcriptional regulator LsrR (DeoR family)
MTLKSRMPFSLDDPACLYEVAMLKFKHNYSEREIAAFFGFEQDNRTQIRKALAKAEETGIVIKPPIALIRPGGIALDKRPLELQLIAKFNLKYAEVLEGYSDAYLGHDRHLQNIMLDRLAASAAVYFDTLMEKTPPAQTVCINWGYTMRLFVSQVLNLVPAQRHHYSTQINKLQRYILPMVGIIGTGNRIQVAEREAYQLALELARKYDAIPRHLPSPAIIRDHNQADVVEQLEPVKNSLDMLSRSDIAITGIGFVDDNQKLYSDMTIVKQQLLTADEVKFMRSRGAVGEIANWFFDNKGQELKASSINNHSIKPIGLGLDGLHKIASRGGDVIAICGCDQRRIQALRACLLRKNRMITALFTDHLTAQELLKGQ